MGWEEEEAEEEAMRRWHIHHRHRPHLHVPWRKIRCKATQLLRRAGVKIAQAALWVVEKALGAARWALKVAKGVLHVALKANAAAYSLMMGLAKTLMIVEYIGVSATLRPNLLDSCLSAAVALRLGRNSIKFSGELCLRNLGKMVVA